jgi:hypothetical protein
MIRVSAFREQLNMSVFPDRALLPGGCFVEHVSGIEAGAPAPAVDCADSVGGLMLPRPVSCFS